MNPEPDSAAARPAPGDAHPTMAEPVPSPATPVDVKPPATDAMTAAAAVPAEATTDMNADAGADAGAAETAPEMSAASPTPKPPKTVELSPAACGTRLAALFPALFVGPDGRGTWKPIKLRIHADIQARAPGEFSKRTLGIFFSRYTTTTAYLKALANAPQRCDLDGQAAGEIADEHRQAAIEELARRQAVVAERRAAQKPAPRREAPAGDGETPLAGPREDRPAQHRATRTDRQAPAVPGARPGGSPAMRPPRRPRDDGHHGDARSEQRPPRREPPAPQAGRPPRDPRGDQRDTRPALPADPTQREHALLLRSFEASPLSKANFCALKGITEAALDAALAEAGAQRSGGSR